MLDEMSLFFSKQKPRFIVAAIKQHGYRGKPIEVINGNVPPRIVGYDTYYATNNGEVVNFPNAYARAGGWRNMKQVPNNRRIQVDINWIEKEPAYRNIWEGKFSQYFLSL